MSSKVKPGIWRRSHYLDRMTLKDLWVAYFQYPAIIGYLLLTSVSLGVFALYPATLSQSGANVWITCFMDHETR